MVKTLKFISILFAFTYCEYLHAQKNSPTDSKAAIHFKIINDSKSPLPDVKLECVSISDGMKYEGISNRTGNVLLVVPINKKYNLFINSDLIDVVSIPNKGYNTITKLVKYNKEVKKDIPLELKEPVETKSTSSTKESKEMCTLEIYLKNKQNRPLAGEAIILKNNKKENIKTGTTNSNGLVSMLLPVSELYSFNLKMSEEHSKIYIDKGDRNKKVELVYEGTEVLKKKEEEHKEKIKTLKNEQTILEAEILNEKANTTVLKVDLKQERLDVIKKYFDFSNLKNDLINYISIEEAILKKLIAYSGHGSSKSTHYLAPLIIVVKNNTPKSLSIIIENGRTFLSKPNVTQNLIVTQKILLTLSPGETKELNVKAMCIQHDNSGPTEQVKYVVGNMADENTTAVSRCIEKFGYYNPIGQNAVWVFSDKIPIDYVAGYDQTASSRMKSLVKILTLNGQKEKSKSETKLDQVNSELNNAMNDIYTPVDDRLVDFATPSFKTKVEGNLSYYVSKTSEVMIAMFDMKGILVRELSYNPAVTKGDHKFHFAFDASVYRDPEYYFKLIINGEVKMTLKL